MVLLDTAEDTGVTDRMEAAEALLKAAGRRVYRCAPIGRETLAVAMERTLSAMSAAAVVAFDAADLEQAAALLAGREDAPLLYGAGSTATVAAYLEQSAILSIAAQNDFAAGYLAVGAAVRAVRGQSYFRVEPLEFVLVRQENMYEPENQKLLFPVTDETASCGSFETRRSPMSKRMRRSCSLLALAALLLGLCSCARAGRPPPSGWAWHCISRRTPSSPPWSRTWSSWPAPGRRPWASS